MILLLFLFWNKKKLVEEGKGKGCYYWWSKEKEDERRGRGQRGVRKFLMGDKIEISALGRTKSKMGSITTLLGFTRKIYKSIWSNLTQIEIFWSTYINFLTICNLIRLAYTYNYLGLNAILIILFRLIHNFCPPILKIKTFSLPILENS